MANEDDLKGVVVNLSPYLRKLMDCVKLKYNLNRRDEAILKILELYSQSDEAKAFNLIMNKKGRLQR